MGVNRSFPAPRARKRAGFGLCSSMRLAAPGLLLLLLLALASGAFVPVAAAQPTTSPAMVTTTALEQQLADRFAPIAMLKRQPASCDAKGEPYVPAPVEVTLGDPQVALRRDAKNRKPADDPLVTYSPTAQDLARRDGSYYLDLPGDARQPGCTYEQFSKARMTNFVPTVYAHIATEPGHDGLALQYWFYYVYNRFNNLHESDWEMIQLTFDASTVAEALNEQPHEIAYAQHGGGEVAGWDDAKVQMDGEHPLVYPAAGSHATYYDDQIFVGWGEHGSGFGCDDSSAPSIRTPLHVELTPDRPAASGPFAWLTFEGRWGEKDTPPYDGPTGPNMKQQWLAPFSWQDGLRVSSVSLPDHKTVGPNATGFFCAASDTVSTIFTQSKPYPALAWGAGALLILLPLGLLFLVRRELVASFALFFRHAWLFLGLGAVLFVLGLLANDLEDALRDNRWGGLLFNLLDITSPSQTIIPSGGAIVQFIGWTLVSPAVIFAVAEIEGGHRPRIVDAFRAALRRYGALLLAAARASVVILPLVFTVVGLPWAYQRLVRWLFIAQAVMLRDATWRNARQISADAVRGRWWQTAALTLAIALVLGLLAPFSGIIVMVWLYPSPVVANAVSGLVYALLFPLIGITMTLWFARGGRTAPAAAARRRFRLAWPRWRPRLATPERAIGAETEA